MKQKTASSVWMFIFALLGVESSVVGAEDAKTETQRFDVVLVVDPSQAVADLTRVASGAVLNAAGDAHRLAIVTSGARAEIVFPLSPIATVDQKNRALGALSKAELKSASTDLKAGLDLALSHLDEKGIKDYKKVVLVLSNGKKEPTSEVLAQAEMFKQIKEEVLPRFLSKKVVIYSVALGQANPEILELSAGLTGGKCLAGTDVVTATDAVEVIVDRLRPPKQIVLTKAPAAPKNHYEIAPPSGEKEVEQKKPRSESDSGFVYVVGGLTGVVILLNLVAIALILLRPGRRAEQVKSEHAEPPDEAIKRKGFSELRDVANELNNAIVDAGDLVEQLNLDLEDFGVEGWKKEKAMEKKYSELARSIFLVIDHLEIKAGASAPGDESDWFYKKLTRILEDEGIEEIPAESGDKFDGRYHKHVGEVKSEAPPGTVVEVKRKGYAKKEKDEKEPGHVLRQAEVVVSSSASKNQSKATSNGGKE